MATTSERSGYDTSLGSKERSATSATKFWAIVFGIILIIFAVLFFTLFNSGTGSPSGGHRQDGSTSEAPGP